MLQSISRSIKTLLNKQSNKTSVTNDPSKLFEPFESIPGPRPLPIIGNIWRYLPLIGNYKPDTLFENAQYNRKRYGTIVREKLTKSLTILHLFEPADIEALFRQDSRYPRRRSHRALLKYRLDRPDLYNDGGLFPENGPNWYRQRKQFQTRLMSKEQVSSNVIKIDIVTAKLIEKIKLKLSNADSITIENFDSILNQWSMENSLSLFLDLDSEQVDSSSMDNLTQELHNSLSAIDKTELQTDRWIKNPSKCPHYKQLEQSQEFLYSFVSDRIENFLALVKAKGLESGDKRTSFLADWLLVDKIDRQDVVAFIMDSFMAGLHTTTYTLFFLLYHVSRNEKILDHLRQELDQSMPVEGKPITIEHIDRMDLLKDCLKETMRIDPVSIGTGRLSDGLVLRNYRIPADIMMITQNQSISRDHSIYEDADTFKPERWSKYKARPRKERPSPFATLPFGFGARSCIGQRLAELQIKVLAARLFFQFDLKFHNTIPTKTTLIHNIDGPVEVRVDKRRVNR